MSWTVFWHEVTICCYHITYHFISKTDFRKDNCSCTSALMLVWACVNPLRSLGHSSCHGHVTFFNIYLTLVRAPPSTWSYLEWVALWFEMAPVNPVQSYLHYQFSKIFHCPPISNHLLPATIIDNSLNVPVKKWTQRISVMMVYCYRYIHLSPWSISFYYVEMAITSINILSREFPTSKANSQYGKSEIKFLTLSKLPTLGKLCRCSQMRTLV